MYVDFRLCPINLTNLIKNCSKIFHQNGLIKMKVYFVFMLFLFKLQSLQVLTALSSKILLLSIFLSRHLSDAVVNISFQLRDEIICAGDSPC